MGACSHILYQRFADVHDAQVYHFGRSVANTHMYSIPQESIEIYNFQVSLLVFARVSFSFTYFQ